MTVYLIASMFGCTGSNASSAEVFGGHVALSADLKMREPSAGDSFERARELTVSMFDPVLGESHAIDSGHEDIRHCHAVLELGDAVESAASRIPADIWLAWKLGDSAVVEREDNHERCLAWFDHLDAAVVAVGPLAGRNADDSDPGLGAPSFSIYLDHGQAPDEIAGHSGPGYLYDEETSADMENLEPGEALPGGSYYAYFGPVTPE